MASTFPTQERSPSLKYQTGCRRSGSLSKMSSGATCQGERSRSDSIDVDLTFRRAELFGSLN